MDVEDPERILLAASQHPDPRVGQMVREIVALWAEAKQEVAEAKRELADIKAIALGT